MRSGAVLTRTSTCREESYLLHPGAMPRIAGFIFGISAVPTPAVAPSFRYFPTPRCCGLIASFPGPCASSAGRLPEAFSMGFLSDSNGVKLCKSCRSRQELSNQVFRCKYRRRYTREKASRSLPKISQTLEKKLD